MLYNFWILELKRAQLASIEDFLFLLEPPDFVLCHEDILVLSLLHNRPFRNAAPPLEAVAYPTPEHEVHSFAEPISGTRISRRSGARGVKIF